MIARVTARAHSREIVITARVAAAKALLRREIVTTVRVVALTIAKAIARAAHSREIVITARAAAQAHSVRVASL